MTGVSCRTTPIGEGGETTLVYQGQQDDHKAPLVYQGQQEDHKAPLVYLRQEQLQLVLLDTKSESIKIVTATAAPT
jgi:hypothetical protein